MYTASGKKLLLPKAQTMALVETTSIALGFKAPSFDLPNVVTGKNETFGDHAGENGTVVMFICNHCPYVIHVREELITLANEYTAKGIGFIAISSNDAVNYPQDAPDKMRELAIDLSFPFPYLYDQSQDVAKAYDAVCTPDFSVFDSNNSCVYRGRLDDSTPGNGKPITGADLRNCLDNMLAGNTISDKQYPSMGCSIKWK